MIIRIEAAKIVLEKEDGTQVALEIDAEGVKSASKTLVLKVDEEGVIHTTVPFVAPV